MAQPVLVRLVREQQHYGRPPHLLEGAAAIFPAQERWLGLHDGEEPPPSRHRVERGRSTLAVRGGGGGVGLGGCLLGMAA